MRSRKGIRRCGAVHTELPQNYETKRDVVQDEYAP
jgi:hypothetical protein